MNGGLFERDRDTTGGAWMKESRSWSWQCWLWSLRSWWWAQLEVHNQHFRLYMYLPIDEPIQYFSCAHTSWTAPKASYKAANECSHAQNLPHWVQRTGTHTLLSHELNCPLEKPSWLILSKLKSESARVSDYCFQNLQPQVVNKTLHQSNNFILSPSYLFL